jgi:hypothetical protein
VCCKVGCIYNAACELSWDVTLDTAGESKGFASVISFQPRQHCDFKSPKPNRFIIGLVKGLLPWYLRFVDHLAVQFLNQVPLESVEDKPIVLVVHHCDRQDPLMVISLANMLNDVLYCAAARETFDWNNGIRGWLFQRFGCFSVDRGIVDVSSIRTMRDLLSDRRKLVIFPEAEITCDDRFIHNVNKSLVHIILDVQDEMAKTSSESLWVLPVGLSYTLKTELPDSVGPVLTKVERQLGIRSNSEADISHRVEASVTGVLAALANHYNFRIPPGLPHHLQVGLLAQHICKRVALAADVKFAVDAPDRFSEIDLHRLRHQISLQLDRPSSSSWASKPYASRLRRRLKSAMKELLGDLDRVERLMIFQRALLQPPAPIQTCRVLDFLELETLGRMTAKGHQCTSVYFGKPIAVRDYLDSYRSVRKTAVSGLHENIQRELQLALDSSHLKSEAKMEIGREVGLCKAH